MVCVVKYAVLCPRNSVVPPAKQITCCVTPFETGGLRLENYISRRAYWFMYRRYQVQVPVMGRTILECCFVVFLESLPAGAGEFTITAVKT
jgi:hypothetical protein